jgi:predicted AAA+ superfamily ATPase
LPFVPTAEFIEQKERNNIDADVTSVFRQIWKGSYPRLFTAADDFWEPFYSSYIQTYIERDVRTLSKIGNELDFLKFMKAVAARIGNLLDYADIAKDVGVSQPTVKSWISILNASGIVCLLQPYSTNLTNRIVKTPKVYFMDTGLAAYLCGWKTPEVLETGAMNGAFFENFVITEIRKSYMHNGRIPSMYFYRDKEKREIDLLIEENGMIYPIEVKKTASPSRADIANFSILDKLKLKRGMGAIVCMAQTHLPLTEKDLIIPAGYL